MLNLYSMLVLQLYWTDRSLGKIFSINKRSGENFREVLTLIYKPIDVVAIHPLKQPYPQGNNRYHQIMLCTCT